MTEHTSSQPWLDALAGSHDRLRAIVGGLSGAALRQPSYCDDWTIAQVLSHLGSGAEIAQGMLDAVLAGEAPPGRESSSPIWDRWNAMSPDEQAEAFVSTDGQLVKSFEQLGARLDDLEFVVFGSLHLDTAGYLGMRLGEHAVHTWDVAVALDPSATVSADAVALLVDRLPQVVPHIGHAEALGDERPVEVAIRTTDPDRHYVLRVEDAVTLADAAAGSSTEVAAERALDMPAEAFFRLVYGRFDPSGSSALGPQHLVENLQAVFSGF